MKNYGKKVLSVLLAVLMCLTVAALDYSGLTAGAAETNPTHSFIIGIVPTDTPGNWDGRDGDAKVIVYGKRGNGTSGNDTQIKSWTNISGSFAYKKDSDGRGEAKTPEFSSDYFPTKIYVGINCCDNSHTVGSQTLKCKLVLYVKNGATGDWISKDFGTFSFKSTEVSLGGDYHWKDVTVSLDTSTYPTVLPAATKVATSAGGSNNATDTVNVTLNATGGDNKTKDMAAYVYDQYNVIWSSTPSSWEKSGTVACTTSLAGTGARETNTLTMGPTNNTYQKAAVTVTAKYGSNYHKWTVNITPTYKVTFNVSENGGTSTAPGSATQTNGNTNSVTTSYTVASDKTASKIKSDTGTWTFVGWNGSSTATTGSKPGSTITIDDYNDTLYAIFSRTATANFYWYNAQGQRTSSEATNSTKTVYNNAASFTFDVPKNSVPTPITINGTSYKFIGWAVDSTTKTTADHAATVTTAKRDINTGSSYNFYALYEGTVKLSYNNNGGSGQPEDQQKTLTLNCGADASAAHNTSGKTTFTVNPDNVEMSRSYSSDFIGWKTAKTNAAGIDEETAQYRDATVTWSASSSLPTTIEISKDTTLYAAFYDFRYNVKFYDYKGELKKSQVIRHNFSATAPEMKTNASDPSHKDANSHYVFDHWEYDDGGVYTDSDHLVKLENGYTYNVYGKYVGHKHIWGDPYSIDGATTCTTGMTYKLKCTVCGYERSFMEEPIGHEFAVSGIVEPTCTRAGSYGKLTCVNCGAPAPEYKYDTDGDGVGDLVITDENRIRPALGHTYGAYDADADAWTYGVIDEDTGEYTYVIDFDNLTYIDGEQTKYYVEPNKVEATCTTAGYYYYTCSRCGEVKRVGNIPAIGHKWKTVDPIEATCTEKGHTGYTYCENENCGLFLAGVDEETPALGHAYVLVEATNSTCTVKGHDEYYKCERCGEYFDLVDEEYVAIEDITVKDKALLDHDYQPTAETIDPTCTEEGHIGAWVCTMCGAVDPDHEGETTPALGHVWERVGFAGYATYADVYGEEYVSQYVSEQPCADPCSVTYTCPDCGETITFTDDLADHVIAREARNEPTCTEEGNIEYWYCEVCGTYFSDAEGANVISAEDVVIPMAPHTLETIPGEAPTCTEDGIPDCYKCTVCGKLFLDAEGKNEITGDVGIIPKLGHNWTDWVTSVMPTDTEPGLEKRKCIRCGTVEEHELAASGHNMIHVAAKAATCTAPGNVDYFICERCGRYYTDEDGTEELETVVIEALGHDIDEDDPTEAVAATCAAEGYNKYVCSRCGHTVIETLPKIADHGTLVPYGENRPATCAAPGQIAGTMCSLCGTVITQPTSIAKLAHTPEAARRDKLEVTCVKAGYTGDLYCSECGQIIEAGTSLEAKGHIMGALTEVSPATCTEYGLKKRKCADCEYTITVQTPVLGHQIIIDKAVAATCTAAGLTEGRHCSRCGEVLEAQETVPATGHHYTETVVEPTCTKLGYTTHVCEFCGDTYNDAYTAKTDHVVGTAATCTDAPVCANCGRSFGEALGHDYHLDEAASTPSTCIAHGTWVYKCTRCGDTYGEERPYTIHTWDEDTLVVVYATCTEAGYATINCAVCGEQSREEIAPLGHDYQNGTCTRCGAADPNYTPGASTPTSEKCEKCGLNHNGRTGLWKQDGFFCKIIAFFRNLFKGFGR